ncbi:MAG: hypothetical protein NTV79_04260 [Candidatus Aureabacteria bacterium]|nr:hypothetical protein [Candidatus Auribacterota bacterium]
MKVRVELLGPLRIPPAGRVFEREYRAGTSVRAILRKEMGYSEQEMGFIQVLRAGQALPLDEKLSSDSELTVSLRLGGG